MPPTSLHCGLKITLQVDSHFLDEGEDVKPGSHIPEEEGTDKMVRMQGQGHGFLQFGGGRWRRC